LSAFGGLSRQVAIIIIFIVEYTTVGDSKYNVGKLHFGWDRTEELRENCPEEQKKVGIS
jgi:hypothetical protein